MKKKKFKKLTLQSETLRNVDEPELKQAAGGTTRGNSDCTAICSACTAACSICCP